jgi:hypothetical protein
MTALRRLPARRVRPGSGQAPRCPRWYRRQHRRPTPSARQSPICGAPHLGVVAGSRRRDPSRRVPFQRRRDPPCPDAAALLAGGRFSRRGLRLGVRLRSRHLVVAVVVGELGHLGRHRPWRGAGGRRDRGGATRSGRSELPAGLRRLLLHPFHRLAAALGDGQPAASRPRPTSGRHHGLRAELRRCLRRCRDITSTSRPRPADWVALLFPCSRGMKRTTGRWRGASQASGGCLPPVDPHRRRPRPGYGQSSPVAEGLAPSSEPMTVDDTKHPVASGNLAAAKSATAPSHSCPGSSTRPCHGRVAWAARRSPVADVGRLDASPRQRALGPARAQQAPRPRRRRPRQRAGRGSGASREAGPAPDSTLGGC